MQKKELKLPKVMLSNILKNFVSFSVNTKPDIHLCAKCFCEFTSNLVNFAKLNFEVEYIYLLNFIYRFLA